MKYFIYCRKSQEAEDRQIMSLTSQFEEIDQLVAGESEITVVDRYEEAFSAKKPGRPLFDEMLQRIEKGEAEGIISWHPDRLARNSMDGGRIIYLLDQGKLKNLRFCSYSFENSSQGKFMLNIIFGYSKYYVDSLSENVKRGLRTKIRNGWRPNLAPIGYRNCKETRTIIPDGEHFTAIQRMFGLLLTGNYTVPQIHRIVCDEWGYITPVLKTRGGKKPALSTMYRILNNPFYAGHIRWQGQLHAGKHKPVITKSDFERAQRLLRKPGQPRPKCLGFPYSGLFTCGACGLSITAERKRKPSGKEYVYYHCTRVHRTPKCTQPSVEGKKLEQQIITFLDCIHLPDQITSWFTRELKSSKGALANIKISTAQNLSSKVDSLNKQLSNLTDLRVREMVKDDEFTAKRQTLQRELACAEENAAKAAKSHATFEPIEILQILCSKAKYWFSIADDCTKRALLKILCSNPEIKDKKALLLARKPFVELNHLAGFPRLCGDVDDVRTTAPCAKSTHSDTATCTNRETFHQRLESMVLNPEIKELAEDARALIERIEPELLNEL